MTRPKISPVVFAILLTALAAVAQVCGIAIHRTSLHGSSPIETLTTSDSVARSYGAGEIPTVTLSESDAAAYVHAAIANRTETLTESDSAAGIHAAFAARTETLSESDSATGTGSGGSRVWTLSQVEANAACGGVASCTVSGFTAIPAGSFLFERMAAGSSSALRASAAASNAGTWVLPTTCTTNTACYETEGSTSVAVAYISTSTGTPTTVLCKATAAHIDDCTVAVYTYTGTAPVVDVGAVRQQGSSATSFAGVSVGTITGTSDLIVQYGASTGNYDACPNSAASPADFANGSGTCGLINSTNNAAGTWGLSLTGTGALGAISFK